MPITPTYPGVYIEELPSGVRTITGVATSITAFIGRTSRGLINEPTIINNFSDFERQFGGLNIDYPLTYTVRDFFQNGGGQAIILRLFRSESADSSGIASLDPLNDLNLEAASPGTWGNRLSLKIDRFDEDVANEIAKRYDGLEGIDFFNLTVIENPPTGNQEKFINVSLKRGAGSRRLDRILEQESNLVRIPKDGADQPIGIPAIGAPDTPSLPVDTTPAQDPTDPENVEADTILRFAGGSEGTFLDVNAFRGQPEDPGNPGGETIPNTGISALEKADLFNLLCIPPQNRDEDTDPGIYSNALTYCVKKRAMLIVDPPIAWGRNKERAAQTVKDSSSQFLADIGATGPNGRNAALYFPRVIQSDPLREGQLDTFVACGAIAGIMARTDVQRGVWKAPAGIDAAITGIRGLQVNLTDDENGMLNPLGINCLRSFQVYGRVVWGARTLRGADALADEYKYVPVRRLLLFLQESLYRGTQWVVFEPNDEPLWAQIRLNLGTFMNDQFRQGAFQGKSPNDAYFVKCDSETTTQSDINRGIVNIIVGFAPLKPAEFVIIKFQQIAKLPS